MRAVARAREHHEIAAGGLRERDPAPGAGDRVLGALDHQHRATHPPGQLESGLTVEVLGELRGYQRLGAGLEAPADAVLDRLRRMRLREHLREEELEEAAVVLQPVVAVVLRPALVAFELLVPGVGPTYRSLAERNRGADEDCAA